MLFSSLLLLSEIPCLDRHIHHRAGWHTSVSYLGVLDTVAGIQNLLKDLSRPWISPRIPRMVASFTAALQLPLFLTDHRVLYKNELS